MRRLSTRLFVAAFALAATAPGIAAYVCHPDPAGTRTLSLQGHVAAYTLQGETLTIALQSRASCSTVVWNAGNGDRPSTGAACRSLAAARPATTDTAQLSVATTRIRPDRIDVLGARGRVTASWPLPIRVQQGSLQVAGGLAAFLSRGGGGLWVTRLSDGRTT